MFSVLLVLLNMNAIGQNEKPTTKGHFIVGGGLTFSTDKYDYEAPGHEDKRERYHFYTDLSFGYFVFNRFAFGLKGGLVLNREIITKELNEKYIANELQLKPFIRYYTSFGIFAEADIGYGFRTSNYITYEDYISDYKSFIWSSGLGYSVFINKNLAIESEVVYQSWKRTNTSDQAETIKTSGLYLNVGLLIYFNTKKKKLKNLNE